MRWPITLVVLLLVLAISLGLYRLESEVQQLERRLAQATAKLEENRHNSRILAAEWSFLSQPGRLQALSRRYLELGPVAPDQIGALAGLPRKGKGQKEDTERQIAKEQPPDLQRPDLPPVPALKPARPQRTERFVLAARGGRS